MTRRCRSGRSSASYSTPVYTSAAAPVGAESSSRLRASSPAWPSLKPSASSAAGARPRARRISALSSWVLVGARSGSAREPSSTGTASAGKALVSEGGTKISIVGQFPGRSLRSRPTLARNHRPAEPGRARSAVAGQERGRDLEVLDESGVGLVVLGALRPDHRGGMHGGYHGEFVAVWCPAPADQFAPGAADPERRPEQRLARRRPEGDHHAGTEPGKFGVEPGAARRDVPHVRLDVNAPLAAVRRGLPAEVLHRVGDVRGVAGDAGVAERPVEEPAGRSHEGLALPVFHVAG